MTQFSDLPIYDGFPAFNLWAALLGALLDLGSQHLGQVSRPNELDFDGERSFAFWLKPL